MLAETISLLEKEVAELKKGFFHSDEQDQELSFEKDELREAKEALSQVVKEMKENEHCRLNLALAETDDEGLEPLLKFMEDRGTLTVNDDNFYQFCRSLRSHGMVRELTDESLKSEYEKNYSDLNQDFVFIGPAHNFRSTE